MTNKTIIIVEDDQGIQEVIKTILIDNGYMPVIVDTGQTMMQAIKRRKPAMLFIDISLSGEDGAAIADQLKKQADTKDIPIVLMSAHSDIQAITKKSKADDSLKKPFDIIDLLDLISKYLN